MEQDMEQDSMVEPVLSGNMVEPTDMDVHANHANAIFSDYIKGPIRQENESYEDYRSRLKLENKIKRVYLKGNTVWNSQLKGEARNPKRKFRKSKNRVKKDTYNTNVYTLQYKVGLRTPEEVECLNRKKKKDFIEACKRNG